LLATAIATSSGPHPLAMPLETFWIDANSSTDYRIAVPKHRWIRLDRVVVRMRGVSADYCVESAIPRSRSLAAAVCAVVAAVVCCAGMGTYWFLHPRLDRVVRVLASKPRVAYVVEPGPAVNSLALDQTELDAGQPLVVRYSVRASQGEVRAIDVNGTVWARAPISVSGISTLALPIFPHDKELRVELVASKNGDTSASGMGIYVRAKPPVRAVARIASASIVPSPITIRQVEVIAGGALTVSVLRHPSHLRVALTTAGGRPLEADDVGPAMHRIVLRVPPDVSGSIVVVTSFKRGSGSETLLRTLPVR
jgi:hypothetical protein